MRGASAFDTATRAIAAAGADSAGWPLAFASIMRLTRSVGTTLEVMDGAGTRHAFFRSHGIPDIDVADYLRHYAAINPRASYCGRLRPGEVGYDLACLTEREMDRHPFYAEFLARGGLRYFGAVILARGRDEVRTLVVHRSPRQGHVDGPALALLRRLMPHLRDALDVTMRLGETNSLLRALAGGLDWIEDGVAILDTDGTLVETNVALAEICRTNDVVRLGGTAFEVVPTAARRRFAAALAVMAAGGAGCDIAVPRAGGRAPLVVSLRPLSANAAAGVLARPPLAVVFVRDPQKPPAAGGQILRELFGLTDAETDLALALQAGQALDAYAAERQVSLNTVYTHLRRLKTKTGCRRQSELVLLLNGLRSPLRPA